MPRVGRKAYVEERLVCSGDVFQFDELVLFIITRSKHSCDIGGMIIDCGNNDGADFGSRIGEAKRRSDLSREMLLADARQVSTKGNPFGLSAEAESVDVAAQVRVGVSGEEV